MKNMLVSSLILFLMSIMQGCQNEDKAIFLLPKGYKGKVSVVFNVRGGKPAKYENGYRLYQIPNDGILLTQFSDIYGPIRHRFYFVDSIAAREEIPVYENTDDVKSKNQIAVFNDGTAGVYGNSDKPNAVHYQEAYISDTSSLADYFKPEYRNSFEKRLKAMVEEKSH